MGLSSSDFCGSAEGGPYLSVLKVFLKCRLLFKSAFICPFSQMWGEVLYGRLV